MGTEVAISFNSLRAQLESERSSLFKIDANIKKIVQTNNRFTNDRFNSSSGDYARAGQRLGGRNSFSETSNSKSDEASKRKHETKTVFSRLSARVHDSDGEDDAPSGKRARVPSAVCRELPTRAAVLRAQGDDEQARTRNRRIFGSLLGTLQKFKQEEIGLQTKEEKKAQVERKIEEQARQEKEREQRERKTLFAERDHKKATIKALEAKMGRVQEFERWEVAQQQLSNFILTKTSPHMYWAPKRMTDKAQELLNSSRKYHERCMAKKRQELQEELQRIEQRCLRLKGPAAKENNPRPDASVGADGSVARDKFGADVGERDREDSDGEEGHEEHHEEPIVKEEKEETKKEVVAKEEQDSMMETDEINEVVETTVEVKTNEDHNSTENSEHS